MTSWPDASSDQPQSSDENTIHSLCRIYNVDYIVSVNKREPIFRPWYLKNQVTLYIEMVCRFLLFNRVFLKVQSLMPEHCQMHVKITFTQMCEECYSRVTALMSECIELEWRSFRHALGWPSNSFQTWAGANLTWIWKNATLQLSIARFDWSMGQIITENLVDYYNL